MNVVTVEIPDIPEKQRGYRLSGQRIADLMAEYVRYRDGNGLIPQPYYDIVSALSELSAYRREELEDAERFYQLEQSQP